MIVLLRHGITAGISVSRTYVTAIRLMFLLRLPLWCSFEHIIFSVEATMDWKVGLKLPTPSSRITRKISVTSMGKPRQPHVEMIICTVSIPGTLLRYIFL